MHKLLIVITATNEKPIAIAEVHKELFAFTETLDGYVDRITEVKVHQVEAKDEKETFGDKHSR